MAIDYKELDTALSMIGANRDQRPLQFSPDNPTANQARVKPFKKGALRLKLLTLKTLTQLQICSCHDGSTHFSILMSRG